MDFFQTQLHMFGNGHPFIKGYDNMATSTVIGNRPTEMECRLMRGTQTNTMSVSDIPGAQADTWAKSKWKTKRVTDPLMPVYGPNMSTKMLAAQFDAAYNRKVDYAEKTDLGGFIRHPNRGVHTPAYDFEGVPSHPERLDFTGVESTGWNATYKLTHPKKQSRGRSRKAQPRADSCDPVLERTQGSRRASRGREAAAAADHPNEPPPNPVVRNGLYQNINLPTLQPGRPGWNPIAEFAVHKPPTPETVRLGRAVDALDKELYKTVKGVPDRYDRICAEAMQEVAEELKGKQKKPMYSLLSTDIAGAQPYKSPTKKPSRPRGPNTLYSSDIKGASPLLVTFQNPQRQSTRRNHPVNPLTPDYGDITLGGTHHLSLIRPGGPRPPS